MLIEEDENEDDDDADGDEEDDDEEDATDGQEFDENEADIIHTGRPIITNTRSNISTRKVWTVIDKICLSEL